MRTLLTFACLLTAFCLQSQKLIPLHESKHTGADTDVYIAAEPNRVYRQFGDYVFKLPEGFYLDTETTFQLYKHPKGDLIDVAVVSKAKYRPSTPKGGVWVDGKTYSENAWQLYRMQYGYMGEFQVYKGELTLVIMVKSTTPERAVKLGGYMSGFVLSQ